ncbi:purine-cytosine permease family protein [Pseudonocardia acaciae]|uniref:purine-cytosine permease family protein n=1 Tax=Pseudonocardia acaciae TaxID=551276 RepID=UPI000685A0D9|nr:cytosine permease [Pseudonocardia acaciae]
MSRLFTLERQTIAPIPDAERHGTSRGLVAIWFGMNMTPLTVVTGATATTVLGLPLGWTIIALLAGNLVGGVGMALHAAQGPRLGVPQMLQARGQFGAHGAAVIVLVALVMFIGYFSSNLVVSIDSAHQIVPGLPGPVAVSLCALVSLVGTVFGYRLVRWLTAAGSYVVGTLAVVAFVRVLSDGAVWTHLGGGRVTAAGFFGAVALGVVWQLTYAPYVSDYSRYLPRRTGARGAFWGSYLGCVASSVLLMVLGAIVGLAAGGADTMAGLHTLLGPGVGFVVLLGFALVATAGNSVNVYCSSLCALTLVETFRRGWVPGVRARVATTLVLQALGVWIAVEAQSGFASAYFSFLSVLLYVLIPWSAVNLVDYYLVRHADYDVDAFFAHDGGRYGRWNVGALLVFAVGVLAQLPFVVTGLYTGPLGAALDGVDLAWLVGFAVSCLGYYLLARLRPELVRLRRPAVREAVAP